MKWPREIMKPLVYVAIITGVVCGSGCQTKKPEAAATAETNPSDVDIPVTVATVEIRPVQRRVSVVGSLQGMEQITITPKVEGRVLATHFDVGDRVPPNSKLLELDPTDYQLAVNEAQQSLELELARLDLKQIPNETFDIEQLPTVSSSKAKLQNAQRVFDRQKNLAETNAGSRQVFEQAETDLKVAETGLRQSRMDARTSLVTVKHREAVLALAKQKLSETVVKSPTLAGFKGAEGVGDFVIAQRLVSEGEMVRAFPSTPVYELIVDDVLKLHVMVPERYISQVKLGLTVEVRVEAYPGEVFPGQVTRINPTIEAQSRSFDVEAHIPNKDHRLKSGGFAKAEVIVGESDSAVTVPVESVTRFAGVSKVFRIRDQKAEEVEISVGTQGDGWVEALGGLQAGDQIVTSGQSRLSNGVRVTIREPQQAAAMENSTGAASAAGTPMKVDRSEASR